MIGPDRFRGQLHRAPWLIVGLWSGAYLAATVRDFQGFPHRLFGDLHLYYQATVAWLAGGDPWAVSRDGVLFAGIPPTLLLNLPFVPLGENAAVAIWAAGGIVLPAFALRRLGLPLIWLAWPPFVEGWFPGSPDTALFGLTVLGFGAIAAVTKPYAAPWMVGTDRWRALAIAAIVGVVTIPLLPWDLFIANFAAISATLSEQSRNLSAWGSLPLMILTGGALIWLGRSGLALLTPGLWPAAQLHYASFSVEAAARSPILAMGLSVPITWNWAPFDYSVCISSWVGETTGSPSRRSRHTARLRQSKGRLIYQDTRD